MKVPYINLTKYYKRFTKKYKFFLIFEIPYHLLRYYNFININYKLSNLLFNSTKKNSFFKRKIHKCKFYLEWGSGASTLYSNKINKKYISIESDKNFYNFMSKKLKIKNIILKDIKFCYFYSRPFFYSKKHLKKIGKSYSSDVFNILEKKKIYPDLILIDGRFRILCLISLHEFLKKNKSNFFLIFDDFQRSNYIEAKKFFHFKKYDRFGISDKIRKISKIEINNIKKKYIYDPE